MRVSNFIAAKELKTKAINEYNLVVMFFKNTLQRQIVFGLFFALGLILPNTGNAQPCDGMKCNSVVNLSLDEDCSSTVTAAMLLQEMPYPESEYVVKLYDDLGNEISVDVDINNVDETYQAKVILPICDNNSCWSDLTVEYKLPPQIDCPDDLTISCGGLDILGLPLATSTCAGLAFEVTLHNEVKERLDCDPLYTHRVERTYRATDVRGNFVECSHEILLERVDLTAIMFPEWRTEATLNAISCSDKGFIFDENGVPLPWLNSNITGSASSSGVPFVCDPSLMNGVVCPLSGSGAPLIPMSGATTIDENGNVIIIEGEANQFCNSAILYTDVDLPAIGCVKKVMRTWEVREWWCSGESSAGDIQMIEIIDDIAPSFVCPPNFTVTTNDDCAGSVELDAIVATDNCDNGVIVSIDYPNGFLHTNGGVAELDTGINMIKYIVADNCYNKDSCSMYVTVIDDTEPVAICERNTVVSISDSGYTIVKADVFDDGTWDECSLDKFMVRRMDTICVAADTMFSESVTFCCEDVNTDVMVVFRAYDKAGNFNDCMVNVEVQDKVVAFMTCPPDAFIDCRETYDLENLGLVFGDPDIVDNCAGTQIVNEIVNADSIDQCGIGRITRLFELMDPTETFVTKTCKQLITISNNDPFMESFIDWPDDFDLPGDGCGLQGTDPEDILEIDPNSAYPIFTDGDDACSLLGWDYDDRILNSTGIVGQCVYIERTWTVINWCSGLNGTFEIFEMPDPQIISVFNSRKPMLDTAEDTITIKSINVDCESGLIQVDRSATDECSLDSLKWSYVVKDDQDVIVAMGDTSSYLDTLVNGEYTIEWSVTNACNQSDNDTQILIIINEKAPTPVCINGLSMTLVTGTDSMGNTVESAEVWASDFDGGSYHTCDNDIFISFSPDSVVLNKVFGCDDIGQNEIMLWVTDAVTGVKDFCSTFLIIEDGGNCGPQNMADVQGEVYTEMYENVEGVMIELQGGEVDDMTDDAGAYAFDNMPYGGNYVVNPSKDSDYLNGVSTLDLIMIQRHILGLQKLDSPYKLIAADINANKEVSAIDLIELRKLVLGIYEVLPNNESWRFVDAGHTFVDDADPWLYDFPENYEIYNLNQNMNIDFIGVKIGDVNSSVIANIDAESIDTRSSRWSLNFDVVALPAESDVKTIAFRSNNYERVSGWQATFEFNPNHIEVLSIDGDALIINDSDVNLDNLSEGWFTMTHFDVEENDIDKDEILFTISYVEKGNHYNEMPFTLSSDQTQTEAYRGFNEIVDIRLNGLETEQLSIVSAQPNPWSDRTDIEFIIPKNGQVNWEFFDINGKKLYQLNDYYTKGKHKINLRRSEINASGVIYVRMTSEDALAEYKMMVIK
ncbi:MAG: hypothetical protein HKN51_09325 [Saprospiraceae bacterium]|nr:hypothetical protein [Saprospiraceae bacterium]